MTSTGLGKRVSSTHHARAVREAARALGFDAVAIARADVALDWEMAHYDAFVGAGMHGEMAYLARNRATRERLDGEGMLRGAKSVVCVARRYPRSPEDAGAVRRQPAADPSRGNGHGPRDTVDEAPAAGGDGRREAVDEAPGAGGGRAPSGVTANIARYARGRDYHGFLRRRIRRLAAFVRGLGTPEQPVRARPLCDDEPVLERAWAARAGLGFIGKNGLLIVPGIGSMVLLAEVVTTLDLDADEPLAGRCGSCTLCVAACPTQAFAAPFVLDAKRCVSYLTIEHRSAIPDALRAGVGERLFGCDDCQTACPFNAGTGARIVRPTPEGDPFAPLERWSRLRLEELLALDDAGWRAVAEGSPLKRAGRTGTARNAAIVLGNRADPASRAALSEAASRHDDAMVREAASWALDRLPPARV